MKTYLMFLQNLKTGEEFVAPVTADDQDEALLMAGEKYPPRFYKVQTFYTLADMERIITDVKRWPGVASSVQQPMMEQLNRRVVTGGPLPALPGQAPVVETRTPVMSAIEAIRAAQATGSRLETREEAPVAPAQVTRAPAVAAAPKRTVAASIIGRPTQPSSASVLDVLKALRG
jgi:hypothetical protein